MSRPDSPSARGGAAAAPRCFDLGLAPFSLEAGPALPRLHLSGWWWGPEGDAAALEARTRPAPVPLDPTPRAPDSPPAPSADAPKLEPDIPTVLLVHALTGDARAGGPGGWWAPLVGPGRALDPARVRLLGFNNLGGCYGSFGASHPDWPWSPAPRVGAGASGALTLPAPVTTWDQARALLRALDALGLDRIDAVVGGSLGGMIALALGALAPERFSRLVPIAACTAASPWIIGLNHVARQAILLDPTWPEAKRGLSVARQLAQMSYRAEPGLEARQGRAMRPEDASEPAPFTAAWSAALPYAQETYLEHQGRKLVARFDAPSYLVQLAAMDHHDLERRPPAPERADGYVLGPEPWAGAARLPARVDAVGIDSDLLYFARHMRALGERPGCAYHEISSPHGHDAFLIEWGALDAILRTAGPPFAEPK